METKDRRSWTALKNYIKGQKNVEANALSRLPTTEGTVGANVSVMMNHPPVDSTNPLLNKNPLALDSIEEYQEQEQDMSQAVETNGKYFYLTIFERNLVRYIINQVWSTTQKLAYLLNSSILSSDGSIAYWDTQVLPAFVQQWDLTSSFHI